MRWAWRVGRAFGIDVYVHATFLLLLAWVAYSSWAQARTAIAVGVGVAMLVAVFAIIVLHELGHALAARRFGIATRDITLYPIGGVARLERIPERPAHELVVSLAGPAVNVALALVIGGAILALGGTLMPDPKSAGTPGSIPVQLFWVNVVLAIFNLLPAFPMDGGRALRALLALRFDYVVATSLAARIGRTLALGLGVLGALYAPTLLLIAAFVWFGATSEAGAVETKARLHGVPVRAAMIRDVRVLEDDATIAEAARALLGASQTDFPVVHGGTLAGVLTRARLIEALAERGPEALVRDAMDREVATSDPDAPLDLALSLLERAPSRVLAVVEGGAVVGMLTMEHLGELLLVEDALRRASVRAHEATVAHTLTPISRAR